MANDAAVLELSSTQMDTQPLYSFLECKHQLMSDFRNIFEYDIRKIMKLHKGHYTESYMSLRLVADTIKSKLQNNGNVIQASRYGVVNVILNHDDGKSETKWVKTMPKDRPCSNMGAYSADLMEEVQEVKEQIKILDEASSRQVALSLLEEDYSKMGQLIECACCFGECVFDNMAQCTEGHLVCVECLNSYINEIAFGAGTIVLNCMMSECIAVYPQSELRRCLDSKIRTKLEERTLLEDLNSAKIKDLVRCRYCDFAAILPHKAKKFPCYRDTCGKVTCRNCSIDWKDHVGLTCSMVKSRDETALRKEYEEKMTKAKVRTCTNCNTEFTKDGGCNTIICRCGMIMCYICRAPLNTIEQHQMHRGKGCYRVTNNERDDERAIQEIKREANKKRKALGYVGDWDVGVPAAKKGRF